MTPITRVTLADVAGKSANLPIFFSTIALSVLRLLAVILTAENPFLWSWRRGSMNPRADMEGPYYVIGAPSRQLEDGKAVLASFSEFKSCSPFLVSITLKDPKGEPVRDAEIDWWQADTTGSYSYSTYKLRGKFYTNAEGQIQILTVIPGKYGPAGHLRAGHFHLIIRDKENKWQQLTSQLYVCQANDGAELGSDFLNFVRTPRTINVLQCWSIPSGGEKCMDFPELSSDELETVENVNRWNSMLADVDTSLKVVAGAQTEIYMNAKSGFFSF